MTRSKKENPLLLLRPSTQITMTNKKTIFLARLKMNTKVRETAKTVGSTGVKSPILTTTFSKSRWNLNKGSFIS